MYAVTSDNFIFTLCSETTVKDVIQKVVSLFFFSLLSQVVRENWDLLPSLASLEFGLESEDEKEGATAKKKEVYASLRNALVDCLETAWEKKSWSWAKVIIDKSKIQ